MVETGKLDLKLYQISESKKISMRDMLKFFYEHGSLRVSDLHLKAKSPPHYRIDGNLQPMKGPPMDKQTVEALAHTLLTDEEWAVLIKERSVDSSYITESMQFRLNCFHDNDGLAVAITSNPCQPECPVTASLKATSSAPAQCRSSASHHTG